MLKVMFGERGMGKSKRIIEEANTLLKTANGTLVYIDDDKSHTREINYQIRFIDACEYGVNSPEIFNGFVRGICAQDFDIEHIYIDGFLKIVRAPLAELEELFEDLNKFSEKVNINITISVNGKNESAPEFLTPYLI